MSEEKDEGGIVLTNFAVLTIFLFAVTFCGDPDLHDAIVDRVSGEVCVSDQ